MWIASSLHTCECGIQSGSLGGCGNDCLTTSLSSPVRAKGFADALNAQTNDGRRKS